MNTRLLPPSLRGALAGTLLAVVALPASAQSVQNLIFDGGNDDRSNGVATDAAGNILVAGHSSSSTASSFLVLKYNAAGTLQWQVRAPLAGEYVPSGASDVAVDAAGNSYAVGVAGKPLPLLKTDWGWLVTSYNSAGALRWSQLYNSPGTGFDSAMRATVHPTQGLYVAGVTADANGSSDWLTIKYSTDGTEQWRRVEANAGISNDVPAFLTTDAAGNVIVVGMVQGSFVSRPNQVHVVKYDAQGNVLWRADYHDTDVSDETPNDIALDAAGNLYIAVDSLETVSAESISTPATVKFNANGGLAFVLRGPGMGGSSVALDGPDAFIVSGTAIGEAGSSLTPGTSRFTSAGVQVWTRSLSGAHLAIDSIDHSIYLTRQMERDVLRLDANGQQLWSAPIVAGSTVTKAGLDDATGAYILAATTGQPNLNILTGRYTNGGTPPPPPPPPPAGPAAPSGLDLSAKKGSLTLSWNDNANNETGFLIERSINGGAFTQIAQVGANVRTFTNSGLNKNTTYTYRVRAFNANGNSAYSNTASGSPR